MSRDDLRRLLDRYGTTREADLVRELERVWYDLHSSSDEKMATHKLSRLEQPEWNPPCLTFAIERHGGTVLGSTRAELQWWIVDLDAGTATVVGRPSFRQLE